jgi:hypothetical protein
LQKEFVASTGAANEVEYLSVAAMGEPEKRDALNPGPSFVTMVQEVTRHSIMSGPSLQPSSAGYMLAGTTGLKHFNDALSTACGYGLQHFAAEYGRWHGQLLPCMPTEEWTAVLDLAKLLREYGANNVNAEPVTALLLCLSACVGASNNIAHTAAQNVVQNLASCCAELLPRALEHASDLQAVSCLFLMAILCLHMFDEISSWSFAGLALTKAISAGFHRASQPPDTTEATSTVFWSLYVLDRHFACVMDRPLSIEDGDMTIQLPIALPPVRDGHTVDIRFLSTWMIHYSHMVSSWRRRDTDYESCLRSLAYWRDTCREAIQDETTVGSHAKPSHILMQAIESQLSCQALVQLFHHLAISRASSNSLLRCNEQLEAEAPRFLTIYRSAIDVHVLGPTILDVWSVFGATLAYIAARQLSSMALATNSSTPSLGSVVAVIKTVSGCVDVLRTISIKHSAVADLQQIIWTFLSALESSNPAVRPSTGNANEVDALHAVVSQSRLPVPRHLIEIMDAALGLNARRPDV